MRVRCACTARQRAQGDTAHDRRLRPFICRRPRSGRPARGWRCSGSDIARRRCCSLTGASAPRRRSHGVRRRDDSGALVGLGRVGIVPSDRSAGAELVHWWRRWHCPATRRRGHGRKLRRCCRSSRLRRSRVRGGDRDGAQRRARRPPIDRRRVWELQIVNEIAEVIGALAGARGRIDRRARTAPAGAGRRPGRSGCSTRSPASTRRRLHRPEAVRPRSSRASCGPTERVIATRCRVVVDDSRAEAARGARRPCLSGAASACRCW